MLRVGLTGELGSGKSTVARLFAQHGAFVLSSDEIGRAMMQPGQAVYAAIAQHFGPSVVLADGQLNRPALARLAFDRDYPRVDELNALVHPAVIAEQERLIAGIRSSDPTALVIVESALLLTTRYGGRGQPWRTRFDHVVLMTAPDDIKITRFTERAAAGKDLSPEARHALRADAQARLAAQRIPASFQQHCIVIENAGTRDDLDARTEEVFHKLRRLADDVQD